MATVPAGPAPAPGPIPSTQNHTVTKTELIFFHPVPGCEDCERMGIYANETVMTYFAPELAGVSTERGGGRRVMPHSR